MSTEEVYIVVIGRKAGKRVAKRHPLKVPLNHATGNLERMSDLAITEAMRDLEAERARRAGPRLLPADPDWNPYDAVRNG